MKNRSTLEVVVSVGLVAAGLAAARVALAAERDPTYDPVRDYEARCLDEDEISVDCELVRGLILAELLEDLEAIEYARDQRGVETALEALEIEDAPEVQIAALRILGNFANQPGVTGQVLPLLLGPYPAVHELAALVLERTGDANAEALGRQWVELHGDWRPTTVFDELGLPAHFSTLGFPAYPGASRFGAGDADRSIGWVTSDAAAKVTAFYADALGVAPLDGMAWNERRANEQLQAFESLDMSPMAEIEKLTEEYMRTQDPAVLERLNAVQQRMGEQMDRANEVSASGAAMVANPPTSLSPEAVSYLIAEEREGRVSRLVMIYRDPALDRTAVRMIWDLADHPPAWSTER